MLIFRKVTNGFTLLDSLPLVCKQWCRVARDPSSWAGVELCVNTPLAEGYSTRKSTRSSSVKA